jgi:hypothetical protein
MKLLRRSAAEILCGLMLAAASYAQTYWQGTYRFYEKGGKNAGGTTIFIEHYLIVFETDGGPEATLKSDGYQTARSLNCIVRIVKGKLLVYFNHYDGENNMFDVYQRGDLLLTLERKMIAGKTTIITYWGKFTPMIPKNEKSGKVYFARSETQRL